MSENRIKIAYEGQVSLEEFKSLISSFNNLVNSLSREVANANDIEWEIVDLEYGSTGVEIEGVHANTSKVREVVSAYDDVGNSLANGKTVKYSYNIKRQIDELTSPLNGRITAVQFKTAKGDFKIHGPDFPRQTPAIRSNVVYGMVKGRVQTITTRNKLQITLFEHLSDKPVYCHLEPRMKSEILKHLDEVVLVSGRVERNPSTGMAKSVRDVTAIERAPNVESGSYKKTKGVLDWIGDEPAEDLIRKMRDE